MCVSVYAAAEAAVGGWVGGWVGGRVCVLVCLRRATGMHDGPFHFLHILFYIFLYFFS